MIRAARRFQLRCVVRQPLCVDAGARVTGMLHLVAHNRQSYDIYLTLTAPPLQPGFPQQQAAGKFDLKEPFYRQLSSWNPPPGQGVQEGGATPSAGLAPPPLQKEVDGARCSRLQCASWSLAAKVWGFRRLACRLAGGDDSLQRWPSEQGGGGYLAANGLYQQ